MSKSSDTLQCAIALRTYAIKQYKKPTVAKGKSQEFVHSEWSLVFDTETTTDAAQQLRFGCYQLRKLGKLEQSGIFYDPITLKRKEIILIQKCAEKQNLTLLTASEFIDRIFFPY